MPERKAGHRDPLRKCGRLWGGWEKHRDTHSWSVTVHGKVVYIEDLKESRREKEFTA